MVAMQIPIRQVIPCQADTHQKAVSLSSHVNKAFVHVKYPLQCLVVDLAHDLGFFLFSLSYQKCVLNKVPRGGATLLIFP